MKKKLRSTFCGLFSGASRSGVSLNSLGVVKKKLCFPLFSLSFAWGAFVLFGGMACAESSEYARYQQRARAAMDVKDEQVEKLLNAYYEMALKAYQVRKEVYEEPSLEQAKMRELMELKGILSLLIDDALVMAPKHKLIRETYLRQLRTSSRWKELEQNSQELSMMILREMQQNMDNMGHLQMNGGFWEVVPTQVRYSPSVEYTKLAGECDGFILHFRDFLRGNRLKKASQLEAEWKRAEIPYSQLYNMLW